MATTKNELLSEVGRLRAGLERFLAGECVYFKGPYGSCNSSGPLCPVCDAARILGVWIAPPAK